MVLEFPVYFYHSTKNGAVLKGKKVVWAENPHMAIKIAECIARHDKEEWGAELNYNLVECGLPKGDIRMVSLFEVVKKWGKEK